MVKQSHMTKHHICLENAQVVAKVDHFAKRCIKEAVKIEKHPENLHKDDGWKLRNSWGLVVHLPRNNTPTICWIVLG